MSAADGRQTPAAEAGAREAGARLHDARECRFGRTYEDLVPGDRFRHWPGKTITDGEHHIFCLLTMAASPLHLDAEFARENLPGARNLVLGTYIYALVLGMSVPDLSGQALASLGVEKLSHLAPVHHGDTLYAWSEIAHRRRSRSRTAAGIVTVDTWGVNQNDTRVIEFRRSFMVRYPEAAG
jgi:acyl dehydratase